MRLAEGFEARTASIIMNNHPAYLAADIVGLARRMRRPGVLFDSWGVWAGLTVDTVPGCTTGRSECRSEAMNLLFLCHRLPCRRSAAARSGRST